MRLFVPVILAVIFSACAVSKNKQAAPVFADNPVVAHRGAWKKLRLPENSIAALRQAIALKCTGSEFDVRMTADDSLIINHDPHYHKLPIEKTTYARLAAYPLSNGEKLPTLRDYLVAGLLNNKSTQLVCEIKPSETSTDHGRKIAARVVALVKELKAEAMVAYISFDIEILKTIRSVDPRANTQYLQGNKSPAELKTLGIDGADYHYSVFKKQSAPYDTNWIASAQSLGLSLNAWTVNDTLDMDWLIAHRFNYITTNEPELLLERLTTAPVAKGWQLTWSDEFNYQGLPDTNKWAYETGGHGWGNNELQFYTAQDTNTAVVANGLLKITALKKAHEKNAYTSAKLVTKNKYEPAAAWFKYGRIEVKAKLPKGRGTWPAIWMLGKNIDKVDWPECGEIDIMEHVGYQPDSIYGTVHSQTYNHVKGTQKTRAIYIGTPYTQFHEYAIEWTPEKIDFFVDGVLYNHVENEHLTTKEWPFDQPFYLILNLAIGGNWGGKMGVDDQIFPATMEVDYVRVYEQGKTR